MKRTELAALVAKTASAGRSVRRAALLKRAYIQAAPARPSRVPQPGAFATFGFAAPASTNAPAPKAEAPQAKEKPASENPRQQLDRMGRDFLLAGKNLVTNPIDTLRRHFNRQPLKR